MTIVINVKDPRYLHYYNYQIYKMARLKILGIRIGAIEASLNKYLLKKYNIGLRPLCLHILRNMTFNSDLSNNIIVKIKNPKLDRIARLITYGNGQIQGSPILQKALSL